MIAEWPPPPPGSIPDLPIVHILRSGTLSRTRATPSARLANKSRNLAEFDPRVAVKSNRGKHYEMMPKIDAVFTNIEQCEMKTEWLTLSKVLKRVWVLEERKIPLEAQCNSRGRVCALQEKWRDLLGSDEESSHRPKTAAGNNQAKPGKENIDPTARKKLEEAVMINGKEPMKASKPDDVMMDEDNSMPFQTSVVEASRAKDAKIKEPETEAPETSPPQANDDQNAVNVQSEPIEAERNTDTNSRDLA
ncbi:hypothetical protein PtA15_3A770 [Puccinia triticina]|uniref:Uncharacterized protein n=1 Tax=Puccinia triticina TaxID=208348 RepID=A0ABY7CF58_9BASI|nr:uncharacterized protein PtA15_3A770 [Puccinia triticina]WAQ83400.1 hypothetical protein PtA15_3A770 [Puccinia triticina]WAR54243.1 hypothetical protein PtB15_3B757 [Puccinia triticina]